MLSLSQLFRLSKLLRVWRGDPPSLNLKTMESYGLTGGVQNALVYPTLPTNFTATGTDNTNITLGWTESGSPDMIQLEWSLSDGSYTKLIDLGPGIETYIHSGRTKNTHYYYRFRCHKRLKWSDYIKSDATTTNV